MRRENVLYKRYPFFCFIYCGSLEVCRYGYFFPDVFDFAHPFAAYRAAYLKNHLCFPSYPSFIGNFFYFIQFIRKHTEVRMMMLGLVKIEECYIASCIRVKGILSMKEQ